jgi:hypothetical protein
MEAIMEENKNTRAYRQGIQHERDRVLRVLADRYEDLASCRADDNCGIKASIVKTIIEDIKGQDK